MELRHLRYFVAVAEELNITRAAARLHVSQPPLSRQIRDLEAELGVTLLERSSRAVKLTTAGRVFLRDARAILERADAALRRVRALPGAGAGAGEIRVGYSPSPTVELLPRALREHRRIQPRVNVVLLDLASDEMLEGLAARTLDVALMVQLPRLKGNGLVFEKLLELPIGIVVAPGHAFARRRSVTLDEALSQPLVAYIRKGYDDYHHWLAGVVRGAGRKPRIVAQADGVASLMAAVQAGQGVAFGPPTFTTLAGNRVKFVPIVPRPPGITVGFLVRAGRRSPMVEGFLRALREK